MKDYLKKGRQFLIQFHYLLTFVVLVFAITTFAQNPGFDPNTVRSRLARYIEPYLDQMDFSGVILIAKGDDVIAQKAYGYANLRTRKANTIATKFRVASLTKTFTAAAIMMLIERGKIKLSDPLSRFFAAFPNGQNIKVEHLLLHKSGVGSLDEPRHYTTCFTTTQLVEEIGRVKLEFLPGTNENYSNSGYDLLAAIIEKVSGESFERFLRTNIFNPLKMNDSGSVCSPSLLSNLATGYVTGGRARSIEQVASSELTAPGSGSVYSTAQDIMKWLRAVKSNRLFDIEKFPYPYGWGLRDYSGSKLIEQSGLVEGFNSYMALYRADDLLVVFLSNIQSGLFNRVPRDLRAVILGGEYSKPDDLRPFPVSASDLAQIAGQYVSKDTPVPLNVVLDGERAYLKWGNYPFLRSITPIAKDKFFHRAEYAELTFERDSRGKIAKISWKPSGGDAFILTRAEKQ